MDKYPVDSTLFKDPDGRWKTAIFYRPGKGKSIAASYSYEEGRKVFLESATEYEAAMRFVTSWEHWKAIASSAHCKPMIDSWREEKLLQDQTKARKMLWEAAEGGNLTAARVIYEAKKEEKLHKEAKKKQSEAERREAELIQNSVNKIVSIKAQT